MQPSVLIVTTSEVSNRTPYSASAAITSSMWRKLSQLRTVVGLAVSDKAADRLTQNRGEELLELHDRPRSMSSKVTKATERPHPSAAFSRKSRDGSRRASDRARNRAG